MFGVTLLCLRAEASLDPPRPVETQDSTGVLVEKGIEFLRMTERVNSRSVLLSRTIVDANAQWKTDWQSPQEQVKRIRQDGRWYTGVSEKVMSYADLWLAAEGEHLDDRPSSAPARLPTNVDLYPHLHGLDTNPAFTPPQSLSAVRILRGGFGVSLYPWQPLRADIAAGPVQDKRIGQTNSGAGLWTQVAVNDWNIAGYTQTLNVQYDRETPQNHNSEDFSGRYEMYREFFAGNSNRAQVSFGSLGRDVYLDTYQRSARRAERSYGVKDILTYGVARGLRVEMSGDISYQRTVQSQLDAAASSLEENQAGFGAAIQGQSGKMTGELEIASRAITQTIRGDILQGRKTDLSLQGQTPLPGRSALAIKSSVSKYALDTHRSSNEIKDDRDELRYSVEALWSKPLWNTVVWELHGLTQLDHLVYIFSQSSANNRWTRLFLFGSTVHHRPLAGFDQTMSASVSANYQDYDFDTDPLTTRSTVHRRVVLGDSLTFALSDHFGVSGKMTYQQEEFGRLFWTSFSEERSDETRSVTASVMLLVRLTDTVQAGSGALWDSRRGERFPGTSVKTTQLVFQDLRSYGPILSVERSGSRGLFLKLNARVLRQFQLDENPRWISLGEMVGGVRW
jgi:hypothetical protein